MVTGHGRLPVALLGTVMTASSALRVTTVRPGPLRWRHSHGFYERHAHPGDGAMGEVLDHEAMSAYLLPGLKIRAKAWRILYRSSRLSGEATTVSGTIMVPRKKARGVVAYAIGTHGLANYSAPSRLIARGLEWEAPLLANLLSMGYAVVMTDYEGLGTPGDHPYVIGRTLGRNVLDSLRAALAFAPAGLEASLPLGVIGYSEGGNSSAWAAELHPQYAPELKLAGIVSGSVPADLETAGEHIDGSMYAFFAGYGALGLNAAYPELNLDGYLTPLGEKRLHRLRRTSVVTAAVRGPHFVGVDDLMTENVLKLPRWQARMRENKLGGMAPTAPVYLYTSTRDPLVPPAQTRNLANEWRELGADVTLHEVPAIDHVTGFALGSHQATRWLNRQLRKAGRGL
ncbi:MAG TPA: lipase family protein [Marmoricola sp.]|nr:lipase family protein [Marmoricola sp.]